MHTRHGELLSLAVQCLWLVDLVLSLAAVLYAVRPRRPLPRALRVALGAVGGVVLVLTLLALAYVLQGPWTVVVCPTGR